MKITAHWLRTRQACREGIKWFKDRFPKGAKPQQVFAALLAEDRASDVAWLYQELIATLPLGAIVSLAASSARRVAHLWPPMIRDMCEKAVGIAEQYVASGDIDWRIAYVVVEALDRPFPYDSVVSNATNAATNAAYASGHAVLFGLNNFEVVAATATDAAAAASGAIGDWKPLIDDLLAALEVQKAFTREVEM